MGDECAASIPLAGWDWAGLRPTTSGECRAARYRFLAEYDGATLTVRQVLSSEDTVALRPLTGAPVCDSPQQGSCGPKDGPAAIAALTQGSSQRVAWHSKDPVGGSDGVLNVAALRSDHTVEEDVRRAWGGPVCPRRADALLEDMSRQWEVTGAVSKAGGKVLSHEPGPGLVIVTVQTDPDSTLQAAMDAQFGAGSVVVRPVFPQVLTSP